MELPATFRSVAAVERSCAVASSHSRPKASGIKKSLAFIRPSGTAAIIVVFARSNHLAGSEHGCFFKPEPAARQAPGTVLVSAPGTAFPKT
jgi:hypothetical protein